MVPGGLFLLIKLDPQNHFRGVQFFFRTVLVRALVVSTKKGKSEVTLLTFEKWQCNHDWEHQMLSLLKCDTCKQDKSLVALLWCSAFTECLNKTFSLRNYWSVWVMGTEEERMSKELDHVACDQYKVLLLSPHSFCFYSLTFHRCDHPSPLPKD